MPTIQAQPLATILNSQQDKAIGSIAEVATLKVLQNNGVYDFAFRNSKTAQRTAGLGMGIGTAIFRVPYRQVIGTDYDTQNGIEQQTGQAETRLMHINKILTGDYIYEQFDLQRFLEANPATRAELLQTWIRTATESVLHNLEAIFIRAVIDYYIANYDVYPDGVLELDLEGLTNSDDAQEAYYSILNRVTKMQQAKDYDMLGVNGDDIELSLTYNAYNGLTRAYTQFIDAVGSNTFASGTLYSSKIMGINTSKNWYLGQKFGIGRKVGLNKDVIYDLSKAQAIALHNDNWAFPVVFQQIATVQDNKTLNQKMIIKVLFGVPCPLRPKLGFIVRAKAPTADEIAKAKSRGIPVNSDQTTDLSALNLYSYQYDPLYSFNDFDLALQTHTANIAVGTTTSIKVGNAEVLDNITVSSDDESIATASFQGSGVSINGIAVGNTNIKVTSGNTTETISVSVQAALKNSSAFNFDKDAFKTDIVSELSEVINSEKQAIENETLAEFGSRLEKIEQEKADLEAEVARLKQPKKEEEPKKNK